MQEEQVLPDDEGVPNSEEDTAKMEAIWEKSDAERIEEPGEQVRGPDGQFIAKEPEAKPEGEPGAEAAAETKTDEPAKEAAEEKPEGTDAPSFLSYGIKQHWDKIPETARAAITADHKEYSDQMAAQGRQLTAIQPIAEQVIKAAEQIPGMRDMTPAQIANDVFSLAQIQAELHKNPVETLLQVAAQYGATEGLKARLAGQQIPDTSTNVATELRAMRQENERLRDQYSTDSIKNIVSEGLNEREVLTQIQEFAKHEHYAAVEDRLPAHIKAAQMVAPEASAMDTLSRAYDMAIVEAGLKDSGKDHAPNPVPAQAQAAIKAKSVNVRSRSTGSVRQLTEDELMGEVWEKHRAQ